MPRIWDKWNFKGLEPQDMRKDEQIKQDASKGALKASLLKKSTAVDLKTGLHVRSIHRY